MPPLQMPPTPMPLTDAAARNAKPKDKSYKLANSGGLYLEILPAGGKYWRMKYRVNGKENRLAFGVYPTSPYSKPARRVIPQKTN